MSGFVQVPVECVFDRFASARFRASHPRDRESTLGEVPPPSAMASPSCRYHTHAEEAAGGSSSEPDRRRRVIELEDSAAEGSAELHMLTVAALSEEERAQAEASKLPLALAHALHRKAVSLRYDSYQDPETGLMCFTRRKLAQFDCCGNGCRHCPHNHINVPKTAADVEARWGWRLRSTLFDW